MSRVEYQRKRRQEHPEHVKAIRNASNRKQHSGFSRDLFEKRLKAQDGKCAICERVLVKPHADHDHQTGLQRGILCVNCNLGLGMFKDNPIFLKAAETYLKFWRSVTEVFI